MLRWAILGTGFISNAVIQAVELSDGSAVHVMAGRNPDAVADFQNRYNIARGASYEQAIADPHIDVVYIGLPNHQHHPYAIAAAHVYPVSLTHLVVQTMLGDKAFADRTLVATGIPNGSDNTVSDAALRVRFGDRVLATIQSSDEYGNTSEFSVAGDNGVLRFVTNPWLPMPGENTIVWHPHDGIPETVTVHDDHDAFYHQVKMVERHIAAGDAQAARPSPRLNGSLEIMQLLTEWEALCLGS